jgi:zinc/manganese transport system permease protein
LLVFALLVLPAATAELLVTRPGLSLAISMAIAVLVTWLGLAMSYYNGYPIGFHITSLAFGTYLLAQAWRRIPRLGSFQRVAG